MKTKPVINYILLIVAIIIIHIIPLPQKSCCQIKEYHKKTVILLQLPPDTPMKNDQKIFTEKRLHHMLQRMGRLVYVPVKISTGIEVSEVHKIAQRYAENHQLAIARQQWKLYDPHYKEERITGETLDLIINSSYVMAPRIVQVNLPNTLMIELDIWGLPEKTSRNRPELLATVSAQNEGNLTGESDPFRDLVEDALKSLEVNLSKLDMFIISSKVIEVKKNRVAIQYGRNMGVKIDDWYKIVGYRKVGRHKVQENLAFGRVRNISRDESTLQIRWFTKKGKDLTEKGIFKGDQVVEIPKRFIDVSVSMLMAPYSAEGGIFEKYNGDFWETRTDIEQIYPLELKGRFHLKTLIPRTLASEWYLITKLGGFLSDINGFKIGIIGLEKKASFGRFDFGLSGIFGIHWVFTKLYEEGETQSEEAGIWAESSSWGYEMAFNMDVLLSTDYSIVAHAGYLSYSFDEWKMKENDEDISGDFIQTPDISIKGIFFGIGFNWMF